MSGHMKARRTKRDNYLDVRVVTPGGKEVSYHIPPSAGEKLDLFLKQLGVANVDQWEDAVPWEELARDRVERYKKAGLVLRGARYRENLSQIELAKRSGVHQNEISKIENGKRTVGEKVAKRLAKALNFDYHLLLEEAT